MLSEEKEEYPLCNMNSRYIEDVQWSVVLHLVMILSIPSVTDDFPKYLQLKNT